MICHKSITKVLQINMAFVTMTTKKQAAGKQQPE